MKKLLFVLLFTFSAISYGEWGGMRGFDNPERDKRMEKELDLTAEQVKAMKELKEAHRKDAKALHEEMKKAREEFQNALMTDATDSELEKKHEKVEELMQKMGKDRFKNMLAIRKILSPEQRVKMHQLMKHKQGKGKRAAKEMHGEEF